MARGRSVDRGPNRRSASASPVRTPRQTPRRGNTPRGNTPRGPSPTRTPSRAVSPRNNRRAPQPGPQPELVLDVNLRDHLTTATNRNMGQYIEKYDGCPDTYLDDWLISYEDIAVARGWNDQLKKDQLPTHLTGAASNWCYVRRRTHEPGQLDWSELTWDEVKKELRKQFLPADYTVHLNQQLNASQRSEEDVITFFHRKIFICHQLGKDQNQTIRAIQETLRPEYRRCLAGQFIESEKELLWRLKNIDVTLKSLQQRPTGGDCERLREENKQLKRQLREQVNRPQRANNPNMNPPRSLPIANRRCYTCGREGHTARYCRMPQFGQNRNYNAVQQYNQNGPRMPLNNYQRYGNQQNYGQGQQRTSNANIPQRTQPNNRYAPPPRNNAVYSNEQPLPIEAGTVTVDDAYTTQHINRVELGEHVPEFRLAVNINGKPVEGLLDTGASMSCLNYAYFKEQLSNTTDLLAPEDLMVFAAGGEVLNIKGVARLKFKYNDRNGVEQEVVVPTIVISELGSTLIIGRDFINSVNLTLDTARNTVYCDEPKPIVKPNITRPKLVYGKETVQIPPRTTKIMVVKVGRKDMTSESSDMTDSRENLNNIGVVKGSLTRTVLANSLIESSDDELMIPITNFSEHQETLDEGAVVGEFEPCKLKAEDLNEGRENPYIFMEKTESINIGRGNVNIGKDLTDDEKLKLVGLLISYEKLFSFDGELGESSVLRHHIDTGEEKPIHSSPYRLSPKMREAVQKQIVDWLKDGVIRPSNSPWSSPVVVVPKKDGSWRMCIDLRGVNKITKKDVYPLPNLEDTLASLNGAMYFSSLDLNQGYMQIKLTESSIPKTAFITPDGLYEFTRMPFGLCNAPATFQRIMDITLSGLKWNQCLVYLDDIVIYGNTLEEHNKHLVNVLQRIEDSGMTIKPSKCAFGVTELKFLGHIVSGQGIHMDPEKVRAIKELKEPTNVTEIRSFIGAASYYRRFVKDFAKIAEPMTKLTRDKVVFQWEKEQQKAFDTIKEALMTQPILCHFDPKLPIELRTDACGYGLGAILLHEFPDKTKRVITYASRLLQGAELNYAISEKECLAIVWAVDKFKTYLMGSKFKIVTDHLALSWIKNKKKLSGRLMRWALMLEPYDYEVEYKSGKHHKDVDHLSRYPVQTVNRIYGTHKDETEDIIYEESDSEDTDDTSERRTVPLFNWDVVRIAQEKDENCQKIKNNLKDQVEFQLFDNLLYEIGAYNRGNAPVKRVYIPVSIMDNVLYGLHDEPTSGHCGIKKTLAKFNERYYTKNAGSYIKKYIKTCHLCQTRKSPWTRRYGMMQPIQLATRPFERIGIDTLGPFRPSRNGNRKIIVVTDYMSKWAIARAVKQENEYEVADMLIEDVFFQFGIPDVVLSDRGNSFRTKLMREIYDEFQSRHITTTAYHPQTNGLTERFNKTLGIMLSMYVSEKHNDWDEYLKYVVFAYNTTRQSSTGFSPYYLLYGLNARLPVDLDDPNPDMPMSERYERLHEARELAISANEVAQGNQKKYYDRNRYIQTFNEGDLVLVYRTRGYIGQTSKFIHPYEGPFKVLRRNSDLVYLVKCMNPDLTRRKEELVHVSRMKPYYTRDNEERDSQDTSEADDVDEDQVETKTNRQRRVINWLYSLACLMFMIHICEARIIWRPTDIKIQTGVRDVILMTKYLLPCDMNGTMFDTSKTKSQSKMSMRFQDWCYKFSRESVNRGLTRFCDDGGTSNPLHPNHISKEKEYASRMSLDDIDVEPENTSVTPKRKRRRHRHEVTRNKRELITLSVMAITAAVSFGIGYFVTRQTTSVASNVEDVAKTNLENIEKLVNSDSEINRRIDLLYQHLNTTLKNQKEVLEQLEELKMEANFENQAIISSLVSNFQIVEHELKELSEQWKARKLKEYHMKLIGYTCDCLNTTCPIQMTEPTSCSFNALDQTIKIRLRQKIVRENIDIVEADSFNYFKLVNDNGSKVEYGKFTNNTKLNKFRVCKSKYTGQKFLAIKNDCCAKHLMPNEPKLNDIPIITGDCIKSAETQNLYSPWECYNNITLSTFDSESVQVKLGEDKLIVYCPYQQYQIDDGVLTDCPDNTFDLPLKSKLTIKRHHSRLDPDSIVDYNYSIAEHNHNIRFHMPDSLRLAEPERNLSLFQEVNEMQNQLLNEFSMSRQQRQQLKYTFTDLVRHNVEHGALYYIVVTIALVIPLILTIMITVYCTRRLCMRPRTDAIPIISDASKDTVMIPLSEPKSPHPAIVYKGEDCNEIYPVNIQSPPRIRLVDRSDRYY